MLCNDILQCEELQAGACWVVRTQTFQRFGQSWAIRKVGGRGFGRFGTRTRAEVATRRLPSGRERHLLIPK
jgi:hypothetical protein